VINIILHDIFGGPVSAHIYYYMMYLVVLSMLTYITTLPENGDLQY
jgi:hypothetical protein